MGPERFFYDKSTYTGTHRHGGPSNIGSGLPKEGFDDLSEVVDRDRCERSTLAQDETLARPAATPQEVPLARGHVLLRRGRPAATEASPEDQGTSTAAEHPQVSHRVLPPRPEADGEERTPTSTPRQRTRAAVVADPDGTGVSAKAPTAVPSAETTIGAASLVLPPQRVVPPAATARQQPLQVASTPQRQRSAATGGTPGLQQASGSHAAPGGGWASAQTSAVPLRSSTPAAQVPAPTVDDDNPLQRSLQTWAQRLGTTPNYLAAQAGVRTTTGNAVPWQQGSSLQIVQPQTPQQPQQAQVQQRPMHVAAPGVASLGSAVATPSYSAPVGSGTPQATTPGRRNMAFAATTASVNAAVSSVWAVSAGQQAPFQVSGGAAPMVIPPPAVAPRLAL